LAKQNKIVSAVENYYKALQLDENQVDVLNKLAWILATTEGKGIRDIKVALNFAQRACELTNC